MCCGVTQVKNIQNWIQKLANLRWDVLTSNRSASYWKMPGAGMLPAGFVKGKKKKHGAGIMFDIFTKSNGNSLGIICGGRKVWNFDIIFIFNTSSV